MELKNVAYNFNISRKNEERNKLECLAKVVRLWQRSVNFKAGILYLFVPA